MTTVSGLARLWIPAAALVSAVAVAFSAPRAAAADAAETRDEKGRTPSEIAEGIRRERELAQAQAARAAQALETRRVAVSLPSVTGECLAFLRAERRCLVTAGEFNQRLAEDPRWVDTLRDSGAPAGQILDIRRNLLADMLEQSYRSALLDGAGNAGNPADEAWRKHLSAMASAVGEERLRAAYREHAASFGPRREVQAEFLGASDSSFLDSLVACQLEPEKGGATGGGPRGKACGSGHSYRWGRLRPGDLPGELSRATAQLRTGEVSEILRGRFGWYVVAATRVVETPARTFEESRPLLLFMSHLPPKPAGTGKAGAATSSPPGAKPPEPEHARGGDAVLQVWLSPRAASGNGRTFAFPAWSDTLRLRPLRIRLSDLPDDVACEAGALLRKDGRGMLGTRFGTWYFKGDQADRRLAASKPQPEKPCAAAAGADGTGADPYAMAQSDLAAKERDFKLGILEQSPADAVADRRAGAGDEASRRSRWIAENVTLEERVLRRF